MWFWHIPYFCNAAAADAAVRAVQTVSLLVLGTVFWWPLIGTAPERRLSPLSAVGYLFAGCVGCTILGIYLTFASVEVCSAYLSPRDPLGVLPMLRSRWGFTPAADQQIGGLIMWVPACLVYLCAILAQFARWYRPTVARAPS
jgi:cytochrome c oxidase assembly factor CtaG